MDDTCLVQDVGTLLDGGAVALSNAAAAAVISSAAEDDVRFRAARLLQTRWLDRKNARLMALLQAKHDAFDAYLQRREEARQKYYEEQLWKKTLPGVLERVWPIIREVTAVLCASVALVLFAPTAFDALPEPFDVRADTPPLEQMQAALSGASVAVVAFAGFFLVLVLLYVKRWELMLYALHSLWIGSLLAGPFATLLCRVCAALDLPLDAVTLVVAAWNLTVPGVLLVHWSATETSFAVGRRLYAALLATLCAWLLASVPYPTAVSALLMLAVLDVLLVLRPGSPVQRLDAVATARRRAGERHMPGLTFKQGGLSSAWVISSSIPRSPRTRRARASRHSQRSSRVCSSVSCIRWGPSRSQGGARSCPRCRFPLRSAPPSSRRSAGGHPLSSTLAEAGVWI